MESKTAKFVFFPGPFPSSRLEEMVTGSGIANSSRIMDKIIVESVKDEVILNKLYDPC